MSTTDIIPGMTEVMDYIKKQEEEIKTLEDIHSGDMKIVKMLKEMWNEEQEKNKKLKEEIEHLEERAVNDYNTRMKREEELKEENKKLKEHLECEEDGYPTSDWFKEKLDFHIKYHFLNEGGEYYEALKDLKEKPNCLDDLIYGSLERLQEEKDGYFQAWLYYWSGGSQGEEHTPMMSEIEDGKYQKILEEENLINRFS